MHDQAFQRAVVLTTAVLFVSLQWRYMDTLLPKFAERVFGASCPWASIYSINGWMCVFCPPMVSAIFPGDRVDDFSVILPGLWIMALSPLCICFSVSQVATAGWIFFLSVGEVLWSPRSQSFIASLAPRGQEGAFFALAGMPTFISQYPTGILSGWLLNAYCPACPQANNSQCALHDSQWHTDPVSMFLWVAGMSVVSPLVVTLASGYLRKGIQNELFDHA